MRTKRQIMRDYIEMVGSNFTADQIAKDTAIKINTVYPFLREMVSTCVIKVIWKGDGVNLYSKVKNQAKPEPSKDKADLSADLMHILNIMQPGELYTKKEISKQSGFYYEKTLKLVAKLSELKSISLVEMPKGGHRYQLAHRYFRPDMINRGGENAKS